MVVFGFLFIPLLVIVKHHGNIRRLLNGTESQFGGAGLVLGRARVGPAQGGGMSRIGILGAGAWGTALAISLARRGGHTITLWSHSAAVAEQLSETGENLAYLPGYTVPADVLVTADLPAAIFEADMVLCVTPSQHLRGVLGRYRAAADAGADGGERDQGAGGGEPAADVAGDCVADGECVRGAERAVVCGGGCGGDSDGDGGGGERRRLWR